MVIYDNLFPEDFFEAIKVEGKYSIEESQQDCYRFRTLPGEFAVGVENFLLGVGVKHKEIR